MNETLKFVKSKMLFLATIIIVGVFGFAFYAKALTACEISCGAQSGSTVPYSETCSSGSPTNTVDTQPTTVYGYCVSRLTAKDTCLDVPAHMCCTNGALHTMVIHKSFWTTSINCGADQECQCEAGYHSSTCSGTPIAECKLIGTSCGSASDCCYGAVCNNGFCGTLGSCLPGARSCSCNSQCCSGTCSSGQCAGTVTENCTDNIDNDGDLKIDCQDPDCPSSCGSCQIPSCNVITHQWDCSPITACTGGDGCCPSGCTSINDSDCTGCTTDCACSTTYCPSGSNRASCEGCPTLGYVFKGSYNTTQCTQYGQCYCCGCASCPDPSTYCPVEQKYSCSTLCPIGTKTLCPPNPPLNFSHIANTISSITWSWVASPGTVTKYQLFSTAYDILLVDNILPSSACVSGECSFQEIGLSANSVYGRKVKACNDYGCSDFSNYVPAYTSIESVDLMQCTSITTNTIEVTAYSAGGGNFSNLSDCCVTGIRFRKNGVDIWQRSRVYSFSGLTADTDYTLTVGPSRNSDGDESGGAISTICRTSPILTVPSSPSNLHHTANTYNTIDWAWNAVPGTTYYNIYSKYYSNGNPYWRLKTNTTDITYHQTDYYAGSSYGWWALTENAMYGFGVSACNVNGCSGLSMADAATSILPPSDIACQNITQTSIRDFAVGSLANITTGSSGIVFREAGGATQDSQSRYWNLFGLMPETNYSFYAKARNQDGDLSAEFGPKSCTTSAPAIIPYSLRIYGPSSSILKLALISVEDALSLNRGTIKTRMPWGTNYAAYLVATSSPNASPVRVMTPMGIKAWRLAP